MDTTGSKPHPAANGRVLPLERVLGIILLILGIVSVVFAWGTAYQRLADQENQIRALRQDLDRYRAEAMPRELSEERWDYLYAELQRLQREIDDLQGLAYDAAQPTPRPRPRFPRN